MKKIVISIVASIAMSTVIHATDICACIPYVYEEVDTTIVIDDERYLVSSNWISSILYSNFYYGHEYTIGRLKKVGTKYAGKEKQVISLVVDGLTIIDGKSYVTELPADTCKEVR